jgi:hypothetical protein
MRLEQKRGESLYRALYASIRTGMEEYEARYKKIQKAWNPKI